MNLLTRRFSGAHDRNRTDDLFLTKEVLHRLSYVGHPSIFKAPGFAPGSTARKSEDLERETGFEPATLSLEG